MARFILPSKNWTPDARRQTPDRRQPIGPSLRQAALLLRDLRLYTAGIGNGFLVYCDTAT